MTAVQTRLDAIQRMADLTGQPHINVGLVASRPRACSVLVRQALRAADGDRDMLDEIRQLAPLVHGRTAELIDAAAAGGAPATPSRRDGPAAVATIDELSDALTEIFA